MTMGTGAFIYASNFAHLGFIGNGVLGPGVLLAAIVAKIILETQYRLRKGVWFKPTKSAWRKEDGKFYFINLVPMCLNALTNGLYTVVMTFAW